MKSIDCFVGEEVLNFGDTALSLSDRMSSFSREERRSTWRARAALGLNSNPKLDVAPAALSYALSLLLIDKRDPPSLIRFLVRKSYFGS